MGVVCRHCGDFIANGDHQPLALCDSCTKREAATQVVIGAKRHMLYLEATLCAKRKQLDTANMQLVTLESEIADARDLLSIVYETG